MGRLFILTLFGTLFFVVLAYSVSAVVCSNQNQILFKISDATNAHAEIWNGANNYPQELCFDNFFQSSGSGDRSGSAGLVVRLSDNTNAHIEEPIGANYNVEVRYDDLVCGITNDLCEGYQNGAGSYIISVSGITNAHASIQPIYSNS